MNSDNIGWLATVPAADQRFKDYLENATVEEIMEAIAIIEECADIKTKIAALERELRKRKGAENMEHDGCVGCMYDKEPCESGYCLGCKQNAIDKYKRMTNADRIRKMTNEELADFIESIDCPPCCSRSIGDEYVGYTTEDLLEWLESEVRE